MTLDYSPGFPLVNVLKIEY